MKSETDHTISLEAYNRFVLGVQNRLIDGDFLMTRKLFVELMETEGKDSLKEETLGS